MCIVVSAKKWFEYKKFFIIKKNLFFVCLFFSRSLSSPRAGSFPHSSQTHPGVAFPPFLIHALKREGSLNDMV